MRNYADNRNLFLLAFRMGLANVQSISQPMAIGMGSIVDLVAAEAPMHILGKTYKHGGTWLLAESMYNQGRIHGSENI